MCKDSSKLGDTIPQNDSGTKDDRQCRNLFLLIIAAAAFLSVLFQTLPKPTLGTESMESQRTNSTSSYHDRRPHTLSWQQNFHIDSPYLEYRLPSFPKGVRCTLGQLPDYSHLLTPSSF
jgi:hypothetical protein